MDLSTIAAISDVNNCKMGVHTHQHTVETSELDPRENLTMKFVVESVRNGCRIGRLSDFGSFHGDKTLPTPLCMLYTRGGSVPGLTRDMLQRVPQIPPVTHVPLPSVIGQYAALDEFRRGLKSFAAMEDTVLYCSLQDPCTPVPSGFNDKHGSAVWSRGGKTKLDVDLYMKVQGTIMPDLYQAICDCDTDSDSGKKRLLKSVERTLKFLDKCLEKHSEIEELKDKAIFGSLVGGFGEFERVWCAQEVAKRPVDGYCIDGFHHYGPETEMFQLDDIKDLLQKTMAELPADKPRLMHHLWTPYNVLKAVKCGIDMFDSSYTYVVSERGGALSFDFSLPPVGTPSATNGTTTNGTETNGSGNEAQPNTAHPFEINLNHEEYSGDFSPLITGCLCYTCRTHTRAYVSHLLNTNELLAGVLLTIHNVHHYTSFFVAVRAALQEDRFTELEQKIQSNIS